jgi:Bacterial SH3 domain
MSSALRNVKIEQRQLDWRCSITFTSATYMAATYIVANFALCTAMLFSVIESHANAQTAVLPPPLPTQIRPISKAPMLPPTAPPSAPALGDLPAISQSAVSPLATIAAKEFRSLGDLPAILYDAPSVKAKKMSILSPLNPLETLARTDRWVKVRDAVGEIGWVENYLLTERRLVTVVTAVAQIRVAAVKTEAIAFEAERGVVLEMIGSTADGWLAVRHRDGNAGFVLRSQVFGQ